MYANILGTCDGSHVSFTTLLILVWVHSLNSEAIITEHLCEWDPSPRAVPVITVVAGVSDGAHGADDSHYIRKI